MTSQTDKVRALADNKKCCLDSFFINHPSQTRYAKYIVMFLIIKYNDLKYFSDILCRLFLRGQNRE